MFNSKLKKENVNRLEDSVNNYDTVINETKESSMKLLDIRLKGIKLIGIVERYINTIANTPKSFEKEFKEINLCVDNFKAELNSLQDKSDNVTKVSGGVAGAGVAAGVGVAAFAPTAAMAIATTFGTASTGTAIASLSGAAATNAALAWLGGGALAAGGGGIAAGNALLALAGPLGWAIGGTVLAGSGLFASNKNKKIADEAYQKALEVEDKTRSFKRTNTEILELHKLTVEHGQGINKIYKQLLNTEKIDFNLFTVDEQYNLGSLVNNTKSFAKLLNRVVEQN